MKRSSLFDKPQEAFQRGTFHEPAWRPLADVYRAPWGWLVKYELAGVAPEDVQVRVSGNAVTISGCRRDVIEHESCCHWLLEIAYSRFERTIELPVALEGARVSLEQRNGMILVRIQAE
ncbi:MAG TPA: Hsp20/alpha crystallin family protein [Planctomycetota bacterium]|jgi:HSP20 family protein